MILILGGGCTPPPERYYQSFATFPIYEDNNKLYFLDQNNKNLYEFNDINKTWVKIAIKKDNNTQIISNKYNNSFVDNLYDILALPANGLINISTTEYITYNDNIATIKDIDTNETIYTQTLPTLHDIQKSVNENFTNSEIAYIPMVTGMYYWDQKTHLASICKNKYKDDHVDMCEDIIIFSLIKDDTNWSIDRVVSYKEYFKPDQYEDIPLYRSNLFDRYYPLAKTFDKKIGRCFLVSYGNAYSVHQECFIKENSNIKLKKFFGEIYPIEYLQMLDKIYEDNLIMYEYTYNYTFDEQGNMHLFYNKREDIINNNYNYFWYGYFTKENLTTPLYEQKIPWDRE